jgi:hypothetical protein
MIFDSIPSQPGDMMMDIRGWTNFILIPYFYPERPLAEMSAAF